jgi:hypothetical protein
MEITTIGLDLAKSLFRFPQSMPPAMSLFAWHCGRSQVLPFFAKLEPCLVGMEACGTSHHLTPELMRLVPALNSRWLVTVRRRGPNLLGPCVDEPMAGIEGGMSNLLCK